MYGCTLGKLGGGLALPEGRGGDAYEGGVAHVDETLAGLPKWAGVRKGCFREVIRTGAEEWERGIRNRGNMRNYCCSFTRRGKTNDVQCKSSFSKVDD